MKIRIWIIQFIIDVIERYIFYPKLKKYYISRFLESHIDVKNSFTVIDVGSNKGQTIEFFSKINNLVKIYGFEPNVRLFEKLRIKYKKNRKITIYN